MTADRGVVVNALLRVGVHAPALVPPRRARAIRLNPVLVARRRDLLLAARRRS